MRTMPVSMSEPALAQLAGTLGLTGKYFLPEIGGGPEEFIKARGEWEKEGLAKLDFDGSLHPKPQFARMLYNLKHVQSALQYEGEEGKTLFLKGPVDVLVLERSKETGGWELALRSFHEAAWQIRHLPGGYASCREWAPDTEKEGEDNA